MLLAVTLRGYDIPQRFLKKEKMEKTIYFLIATFLIFFYDSNVYADCGRPAIPNDPVFLEIIKGIISIIGGIISVIILSLLQKNFPQLFPKKNKYK